MSFDVQIFAGFTISNYVNWKIFSLYIPNNIECLYSQQQESITTNIFAKIHWSRHTVVCQWPRETQDTQCVIYRKRKVATYTWPCIIIVSSVQDIHFEILSNFLHIFVLLLLLTAFEECLNHVRIIFPWFDFFQI